MISTRMYTSVSYKTRRLGTAVCTKPGVFGTMGALESGMLGLKSSNRPDSLTPIKNPEISFERLKNKYL